jgi:molybdate transport system substrate-binding protein
VAALFLAFWCSAGNAEDLIVSAAASLADAFREIGKAYESGQPGDRVVFNFAASGALLQQIIRGAPVDVLASADRETMDKAQERNLIVTASRADFARNELVIVTRPGLRAMPRALEMLRESAIERIAIGNPDTVPAGRYARATLEAAGLWPVVQSKIIRAQNVRQSLDYLLRGEVDAAFVYATDIRTVGGKLGASLPVATPMPIRYPIAAVRRSGDAAAALRFVRYVNSAPAREILARHGFLAP